MIFIINDKRYIDIISLKEIIDMPKSTLQRELNKMNITFKKYKNMHLYEVNSLEKNIIKRIIK